MSGCEKCGGCSGCAGCGELVLSPGELEMLRTLGQIPFLPVGRQPDGETPVYLEDGAENAAEAANILLCLEKRGLILLDYGKPLKNAPSVYGSYPVQGSISLTQRGQRVLEMLDYYGWEEI